MKASDTLITFFCCFACGVGISMLGNSDSAIEAGFDEEVRQDFVLPESRRDAPMPDDLIPLVLAIAEVESGGNANAIGDDGLAVGLMQIQPIMVEDVNRILEMRGSDKRYTTLDRYSPELSIRMFWVYTIHYAEHHDDFSFEGIARRWNGGPDGHLEETTLEYWERVQRILSRPNGQSALRGDTGPRTEDLSHTH